jgi:hypothetical protein
VAPFFPFNPQDTRDADVAELSRLINPQDGVLWRQQRWFDALVVAEIKGTRFFTPPAGRADFLAACSARPRPHPCAVSGAHRARAAVGQGDL